LAAAVIPHRNQGQLSKKQKRHLRGLTEKAYEKDLAKYQEGLAGKFHEIFGPERHDEDFPRIAPPKLQTADRPKGVYQGAIIIKEEGL
jgi:hypothetical protein